jgi:hypothetical protein
MTTFPTGLATSPDGVSFDWTPNALPVGTGWDRYQARLTTVIDTDAGYVGLYDGSRDASENYEERTGLAVSSDLSSWTSITPDQPWRTSPHSTGSLRYGDIVAIGDTWFIYYEYARPDSAHHSSRKARRRSSRIMTIRGPLDFFSSSSSSSPYPSS